MPFREEKKSLCESCRYVKRIQNARGSVFWLCTVHRQDPTYAKYPRQPVLTCAAYQKAPDAE